MPAIIGGALAGVGALAGGGASMLGAGKSSSAAKDAARLQQQQYQQTRADLQPYNVAGQGVLPQMDYWAKAGPTGGGPDYVALASSLAPGRMTQQELEATPGYQFTRDQGLKAVQSAAAARGLGVSGSSLKGAAAFATGLADKTYMDQFNIQQQRFQNALALNTGQQGQLTNMWSRLIGLGTLGEDAAAKVGAIGQNLTGAGATSLAGQEQGAGLVNATNALNQGLQNYMGYKQFQQYMDQGGGRTGAMTPQQLGIVAPGYNPAAISPTTTGYNVPSYGDQPSMGRSYFA